VAVVATFEREAQRFLTRGSRRHRGAARPGLEVTKAWLPVETHVISREVARELGQPELKGFYITQVYPNSTPSGPGSSRATSSSRSMTEK